MLVRLLLVTLLAVLAIAAMRIDAGGSSSSGERLPGESLVEYSARVYEECAPAALAGPPPDMTSTEDLERAVGAWRDLEIQRGECVRDRLGSR